VARRRRGNSSITHFLSDISDDIKDSLDDDVFDRARDAERDVRRAGLNWTPADADRGSRRSRRGFSSRSTDDNLAGLHEAVRVLAAQVDRLTNQRDSGSDSVASDAAAADAIGQLPPSLGQRRPRARTTVLLSTAASADLIDRAEDFHDLAEVGVGQLG
jgi:hypothetical protein